MHWRQHAQPQHGVRGIGDETAEPQAQSRKAQHHRAYSYVDVARNMLFTKEAVLPEKTKIQCNAIANDLWAHKA